MGDAISIKNNLNLNKNLTLNLSLCFYRQQYDKTIGNASYNVEKDKYDYQTVIFSGFTYKF